MSSSQRRKRKNERPEATGPREHKLLRSPLVTMLLVLLGGGIVVFSIVVLIVSLIGAFRPRAEGYSYVEVRFDAPSEEDPSVVAALEILRQRAEAIDCEITDELRVSPSVLELTVRGLVTPAFFLEGDWSLHAWMDPRDTLDEACDELRQALTVARDEHSVSLRVEPSAVRRMAAVEGCLPRVPRVLPLLGAVVDPDGSRPGYLAQDDIVDSDLPEKPAESATALTFVLSNGADQPLLLAIDGECAAGPATPAAGRVVFDDVGDATTTRDLWAVLSHDPLPVDIAITGMFYRR